MIINEKKTKTMIINFTENFKFTTRLKLKNENVDVVNSTKLLGIMVQTLYILFVRSLREQSATVWHSSLSKENIKDLERVQKTAIKVIL